MVNGRVEGRKTETHSLTKRENEVAKLVCLGYSNAMIADALGIKEKTVKFHLYSIYRITRSRNRAQFIANYYINGSFYGESK